MSAMIPKKPSGQMVASLLLLTLSVAAALLFVLFRPQVETAQPKPQASFVRILRTEARRNRLVDEAFGTVQPDKRVSLKPEVSGRIVEKSPGLIPGGYLKRKETVLRIDPREYDYLLEQEKAALAKAEFDLKVEEGRQVIAKREWELLDPKLKKLDLSEELALRKAHLKERKAAVEGAKSRVSKALLDLERTTLTSPFDALVLSEDAEVGQLITPQTAVADLVATEEFRLQVSIPFYKLAELEVEKPKIVVRQELASGVSVEWPGRLIHLLADIDPSSRMARLLIGVKDPLNLKESYPHNWPLLLGSYVRVDFYGERIPGSFRIPREALREGDKVWIMNEEDRLEVRPVGIAFKERESVVIDKGLQEGERLIVSPLPLALPGMLLKEEEKSR